MGQGLAVPVKNIGFERSPATSITIVLYNAKSRQLLSTKSFNLPPMQPGQTRRSIVVPPQGVPVSVRAIVDPSNRVPETNEGNNSVVSRH
ncbi:MAG: hypothetical protein KDA37_09000 [Planctomycetales bacterium]|nr:hypothetical protein [Planctomycetales bacterium]